MSLLGFLLLDLCFQLSDTALSSAFTGVRLVAAGLRLETSIPVGLCFAHLLSVELADWMHGNPGLLSISCPHILC